MTSPTYGNSPGVYTPGAQPGANSPMAAALRTAQSFTRAQVADLISLAFRSGYEWAQLDAYDLGYLHGSRAVQRDWDAAAAEQVASFNAEDTAKGAARRWLREQQDAAARVSRIGDHPGGPVPMWGAEEPDLRVAA